MRDELEQRRRGHPESEADFLARIVARSRAILESTTDALLVIDGDRRVADFNRHFTEMWGIAPETLESCPLHQLYDRLKPLVTDAHALQECFELASRPTGDGVCHELERVDGRVIEVFYTAQRVDGKPAGHVWSFRDVTEHRRTEQEHSHLAAIVTSSNDAIISKTLEGIITSWNAAAERMFGYASAEAVGRPITLIIPAERVAEEQHFLRMLRRGERIENFATVRVAKDGRHLHVSLTISPIRDHAGHIIGASKTARDVTEREQLLAREQAARARAEEASRLKDDFLATVSHELRTPLNAILGWAHLLRSGALDPDRTRHAVEVIERNAHNQSQVIGDILDVSRIITGKLRLEVETIMPVSVIEAALESVRHAAEAKGVKLTTDLDPAAGPIRCDPGRLQQIVWNLVANSIKFTGSHGRVDVKLTRSASHVLIVVADTGEGIDPGFLPHVFDRFRQADASTSRASGGLGLGLAIVRHLAELHGGLVTAQSPGRDQGATFTVRLPLQREGAAVRSEGQDLASRIPLDRDSGVLASAPRLDHVRVLVVDDEPDARELLRQILESTGAEVRDAASARQGMELLTSWSPHVIVSDIGMPGEDGYRFIRQIRELERGSGRRIPAIALSAYARGEDRLRALRAGYQVHVAKPVDSLEFTLVLAGLVQPIANGDPEA
jgi:PAS domain S-box-containing protein